MFTVRHIVGTLGCLAVSASLCLAQNIAPSHSGTVDYFQGDVSIDGLQLVSKTARFSTLKEQSVLKTDEGRAELLLTPGVILRVGENSSVRMLDSDLMHTRVQLVSGTAMVEAMESGTDVKDPPVTVVYNNFQSQPVKYGIYEISADPAQMRVFEGEARVAAANSDQWTKVKDGHQLALTTEMASAKFDDKIADDLYLWSRDRSGYLAAGNLSSARALASNTGFGGYGSLGWDATMWNGFSGGWYYNSFLNMYSYMPFGGSVYSPFGYGIYNPVTIGYVYMPTYYWSGAGGARTGTTGGVPLTGVSRSALLGSRSGSNAPQLPRLGTTATLRPTINAPLRGAEIGSPRTAFSGRNGLAGDRSAPIFNNNVNNSVAMRPSPSMSVPMSAPSAAPAAAAPSAGARVGAARR
ncbi:MAG TPA: hypothetical protein VGM43_20560 [Bryobacteraceae bacterium]|jgi:hypothetical protein